MPLKVRILFNRKIWPIGIELKAIQDWFPIKLNFEVHLVDIEPEWLVSGEKLSSTFIRRLLQKDDDILVLNLTPEDWTPKTTDGYAKGAAINGKKFIAMKSAEYIKRTMNHGWLNNNEFAGRLRHELTHTFYQMANYQTDNLHKFEYEQKAIEKTLDDIKWENIPNIEFKLSNMKKTHINIHHTAIIASSDNISQFDSVNRSHKLRFGESVKSSYGYYVGYHYLIERNGVVQQARKDHEVGAHNNVDEMNYKAIGVCFAGNMEEQELTQDQIKAGLELINELVAKHKIPRENILPHKHFKATACPGKNTLNFIKMVQNNKEPEWFTKTTRPWAENILSDVDGFIEDMTPYKVLEVIRKATE